MAGSGMMKLLPGTTDLPDITAYIRRGADSLDLTSRDLLDKIINLRFIQDSPVGTPEKFFTFRSDYEVVYGQDGSVQYRLCRQKPEIKVEYKQVANTVAIEVNIEVTNLFVRGEEIAYANEHPVRFIELQMGYINQFPDWTTPEWKDRPLSDFYALLDNNRTRNPSMRRPGKKIRVQVLDSEMVNMPPDMVTRFHGIVGTVETGLRWLFTTEELLADWNSAYAGTLEKLNAGEPLNPLPGVFFHFVTRRFIRPSIPHRYSETTRVEEEAVETASGGDTGTTAEKERTGSQTIEVFGYDRYNPSVFEPDKPTLLIPDSDGLLTEDDAWEFGILVYMSDALWTTPMGELPAFGITDTDEEVRAKKIAQRYPTRNTPFSVLHDTVGSQIQAIQKQYPFLRFYILSDGNYFAYHVEESEQELFKDSYVLQKQKEAGVKLPAVYDITLDGTRKIRCPFISWIDPMMTVLFQSRYAIGTLVGFYYHPERGHSSFLVLLNEIQFSTTGEDNMMTLTCTDIKGEAEPKTNADGSMTYFENGTYERQKQLYKVWERISKEVNTYYSLTTINGSWSAIAASVIGDTRSDLPEDVPNWTKDNPATTEKAMALLEEDNPELFTDERISFTRSPESETPGVAGRKVAMLYNKAGNPVNPGESDFVVVRSPFLPMEAYTPDTEIT